MEQINEQHPHRGDWLREIVFGLNDGLVTTLVFIMAVSEVAPARLLLVVLGEVLAGGISMALGGYLSARTAKQILDQRIATERYEIEHLPEQGVYWSTLAACRRSPYSEQGTMAPGYGA
jgi:VIT1/CCC1 family predicted Fe2+/Mn2+ transporter